MGIDYYGVLRLTRTCTDLDIKMAYRRLSIQFHPKRLKSKDAMQTFELICEAYDVLVDPLKRAIFDQYGEEGLKSGVVTPEGYFEPYIYHGKPLQTLRDFFGTDSPYADLLSVIYNPLPMYDLPEGRGIKTKGEPVIHPLQLTLEELYHGGIKKMKIQRLVFQDESKTVTVLKEKILTIPIKPGLPPKSEFIFPEEGDQGPTKIPADVVFITQDKPHPVFERVGNDLIVVINIKLLEALTGYTVVITTLDDRTFRVPITDVIHPTYEKVVEGEGMPIVGTEEKGNLIIRFNIEYPQYFPLNCKTMLTKAFNCANISGGATSPELVNKMILHDKMNRIDKADQKLP